MKLWSKGYQLDALIEQFTVGEDYLLDQVLVPYDCAASLAHATMLNAIGILTGDELDTLQTGLQNIKELHENGNFEIKPEQEDCHTAIENFLVANYGEVGKKIHTARSRNDQVLVALRLYEKQQLQETMQACQSLAKSLVEFAEKYATVPIPGRTHMQLAMPSSLGLWAGAIAESIVDDITMLKGALDIIDQCPLGSASSYGVAIAIDRQMTSDLLGFKKVQNNVLYANNSRGKLEAHVICALQQVMLTLSKAASDLMFFSLPEIGYVKLSDELCSGSSLMPQKKNPDALELVRAKAGTVSSYLLQVLEIVRPLPSGYHRDFQETKAPLIKSFDIVLPSIHVIRKSVGSLQVKETTCLQSFTPELFATDLALKYVQQGVPFRDAYQRVASELEQVQAEDPVQNILSKTHLGATGNLNLELLNEKIT